MRKLILYTSSLQLLIVLTCASVCIAQESFPAHDLKFQNIFASRTGDPAAYFLLGNGWLRPLTTKTSDVFVKRWLDKHPNAVATLISAENFALAGKPPAPAVRWVYIWIEDSKESLNVALVQEGIFPGGVMLDMVETRQRLTEILRDPKLSEARAKVEKEVAERPVADRPRRLVSEADYAERIKRIVAAEREAREHKKGIWSDEMKEERETEGMQ
jgi:hypothetical protein